MISWPESKAFRHHWKGIIGIGGLLPKIKSTTSIIELREQTASAAQSLRRLNRPSLGKSKNTVAGVPLLATNGLPRGGGARGQIYTGKFSVAHSASILP